MALDGTVSGLKVSLATELVRTDITDAQLNDWIATAEAQMMGHFLTRKTEGKSIPRRLVQRSDATFALGDEYIAVPSDYVGAIALELTATPPIDLDYIGDLDIQREKKSARWTGSPKFYAEVSGEFQIYPVADAAYAAELTYIKRLPALSVSNTSNWVLTDHPHAYLYGMALAAAPGLLMEPGREAGYAQRFQDAVDRICDSDPKPSNKVLLRADNAITRYLRPAPYTTASTT